MLWLTPTVSDSSNRMRLPGLDALLVVYQPSEDIDRTVMFFSAYLNISILSVQRPRRAFCTKHGRLRSKIAPGAGMPWTRLLHYGRWSLTPERLALIGRMESQHSNQLILLHKTLHKYIAVFILFYL